MTLKLSGNIMKRKVQRQFTASYIWIMYNVIQATLWISNPDLEIPVCNTTAVSLTRFLLQFIQQINFYALGRDGDVTSCEGTFRFAILNFQSQEELNFLVWKHYLSAQRKNSNLKYQKSNVQHIWMRYSLRNKQFRNFAAFVIVQFSHSFITEH